MKSIYRVRLETLHFVFESFGVTQGEAELAFRKGWNVHALATGAVMYESREFAEEFFSDIERQEIRLGECYRDRELIETHDR